MAASPDSGASGIDVDLTISIVTWNSRRDIENCLNALPAAIEPLSWQATVFDNASSDGAAEFVRECFPQVALVASPQNVGFGAGHNAVMSAGIGRAHVVLNPDAFCHPGSLRRLFDFLQEHPAVGLVGPRVLTATGEVYPSCRSFPTPGALFFRNRFLSTLFPRNPYLSDYLMGNRDHTMPMEAGWLSAAALMVRREALESIGLFDDRFFMYCEDMDWSRRAHDSGWEVWYEPAAVVTHLHARSTDQRIPSMIIEHHRSMWKYFQKHERSRRPLWWNLALGAVLGVRASALVLLYLFKKAIGRLPKR